MVSRLDKAAGACIVIQVYIHFPQLEFLFNQFLYLVGMVGVRTWMKTRGKRDLDMVRRGGLASPLVHFATWRDYFQIRKGGR